MTSSATYSAPSTYSAPTSWRVGATPEPLPTNDADWGWQAQQGYAIGTAKRVDALEQGAARAELGSVGLALTTGLLGGLIAAAGYMLWRRGL